MDHFGKITLCFLLVIIAAKWMYPEQYEIYDDRTFGSTIYSNPCQKTTNAQFRKFVNDNVVCKGKWCVNSTFNCVYGNSQNCYNVEHIIDKRTGLNTDIAGNMVMAYGKWNQKLGRMSYDKSHEEKIKVYGYYQVDLSYNYVKNCHHNFHLNKFHHLW